MDFRFIVAVVAITLALIFYSIGVWAEHRAHILKKWHTVVFWIGLICDTTGTTCMSVIATSGNMGAHGVTGLIAIILMLIHALWATITLVKNNERQMQIFHRFSMFVWLVWLIPYFMGMFMGMGVI